jgi:hypothetical protein
LFPCPPREVWDLCAVAPRLALCREEVEAIVAEREETVLVRLAPELYTLRVTLTLRFTLTLRVTLTLRYAGR